MASDFKKVGEGLLPWKPEGYWMDFRKTKELDTMISAIKHDFDFVGLYSGHGNVRIGKSVNAMQDGFYITTQVREKYGIDVPWNVNDNFAFRGDELIEKAKKLPPYSVIIYDEAGSDLVGRKFMQATTQALLDFFRECGQLNLFLMCVLPDYFELPKPIAINRSTYLVDVDFKEAFTRGKFNFYGPRSKKYLYLMGKRWLDYDAAKPDFSGFFDNVYTVDEKAYRERKYLALTGRQKEAEDKERKSIELKTKKWSEREAQLITQRNILVRKLVDECKVPLNQVGVWLGKSYARVYEMYANKRGDTENV